MGGGGIVTMGVPGKVEDALEGNPENAKFHSVSPYRVLYLRANEKKIIISNSWILREHSWRYQYEVVQQE